MNKSKGKRLISTAVMLGFTVFLNTELWAVDHDGFQQQPPKKPLNKKTEHKPLIIKANPDDHHDHDGIQKPKKSLKKTEIQKDAASEKHHDQHHDHDGIKKIPKKVK